eukprot:g63253.t1
MRASLLRRCPSLAARPSILESSIHNVNAHSTAHCKSSGALLQIASSSSFHRYQIFYHSHTTSSCLPSRFFSSNAVSASASSCSSPSPSFSSPSTKTASSSKSQEGLQLSPEFVERMLELRKKQGKEKFLRVSVEGGGCSGMQYKYDLVDDIADDDKVFTRDGVSAIVDPVSLPYMNGAVLTFEDQLIGGTGRSAFTVIDNPNIESSCGCNVSFSPIQL